MSRDQQADGAHGYGICVKGGKETGNVYNQNFILVLKHTNRTHIFSNYILNYISSKLL